MAQFSEVMRQARRMCESFSDGHCSECPIGNANVLECGITVTSEMDCKEVEHRVMQWAQEHPELVYPTWAEWQDSTFPNATARIRPCWFIPKNPRMCNTLENCYGCCNRPIPAEIADKLGIKPKEAK